MRAVLYCESVSVYHANVMSTIYTVDELIRQITINCAERGVLLVRVRDEARMAIAGTHINHKL